jgi:hypothetical protein
MGIICKDGHYDAMGYFWFFAVLGFELRAYVLSHSSERGNGAVFSK